jgi:hypothetical protein
VWLWDGLGAWCCFYDGDRSTKAAVRSQGIIAIKRYIVPCKVSSLALEAYISPYNLGFEPKVSKLTLTYFAPGSAIYLISGIDARIDTRIIKY